MKRDKSLMVLAMTFILAAWMVSIVGCGKQKDGIISETFLSELEGDNTSEKKIPFEEETSLAVHGDNYLVEDCIAQMQSATYKYPSQSEEWKYNIYDCYVEITEYIGAETENLLVPAEIEGLPVWVINSGDDDDGDAAYWETKLSTVQLPDSILVLGDYVFANCDIKNINLPKNLVTIGEGALRGNKFSSITLPGSTKTIGDYAFYRCAELTNISFPEGLVTIGEAAFNGCDSITNYSIPASVQFIGKAALQGGRSIDEVTVTIYNPEAELEDILYADGGWVGTVCGYESSTAAEYCSKYNDLIFKLIP